MVCLIHTFRNTYFSQTISCLPDEGNENVTTLFNILTTFALNHPSVGYCQVSNSNDCLAY